jgi:sarcosine oxidase subunit alpha
VAQAREAGVEVLSNAPALAYFDGLVPVWQGDTLHQIRARRHVFATGCVEQPLVFAQNDLPGVMLSGGALRLAALYGVSPGRRAVVATTSDRGLDAALALRATGVEIVAVADARPAPAGPARDSLVAGGTLFFPGHTVVEATGRKAVTGAVVGQLDGTGGTLTFPCDLIIVSGGAAPASSLALQAGARTAYDSAVGHFALTELPEGVLAAGELAGHGTPEAAEVSGELAGTQAASELGFVATQSPSSRNGAGWARAAGSDHGDGARRGRGPGRRGQRPRQVLRVPLRGRDDKDIHLSVEEGYDSIELSKRYTTVTMGPCQGADVPGALDPADGPGDGPEPPGRRHDHRAAAVVDRADGRARRAPDRAGQALGAARAPPGAGRHGAMGGRLAPGL